MMAMARGNQLHMRICSLTICTLALTTSACLTQTFAPPPVVTTVHRAFMTDGAFAADFGGLSGADALCQAEADGAALGGTWLAWLADDNDDPVSRFTKAGVFVRIDGVLVAQDFKELVSGTLENPIALTPTGQPAPIGGCWTSVSIGGHGLGPGTLLGNVQQTTNCANWTSRDSSLMGATGQYNLTDQEWTIGGSQNCDPNEVPPEHLYCFEQ